MQLTKMEFHVSLLLCVFLSIFSYNTCFALSFEPIENLKNISQDFVKKNIALNDGDKLNIQFNQGDLPTRLPLCSKPIEPSFPNEVNKEQITAVTLTCNGLNPWHVYVPVDVQIITKVLVAKHAIVPDQVISEDDVDFAEYDTRHLYSGFFKDKNLVIGQTTSHTIPEGAVLNKKNIHSPFLVHRNQEVDLVAKANTVEVTMKGISKSDGGMNDSITAYNPSSKKILNAIVIGVDKAEVI